MSDHFPDATKKVHACEPAKQVVPFWYDCKHCGKEIEPVYCQPCAVTGHGFTCPSKHSVCRVCKESGVIECKEAQP